MPSGIWKGIVVVAASWISQSSTEDSRHKPPLVRTRSLFTARYHIHKFAIVVWQQHPWPLARQQFYNFLSCRDAIPCCILGANSQLSRHTIIPLYIQELATVIAVLLYSPYRRSFSISACVATPSIPSHWFQLRRSSSQGGYVARLDAHK